MSGHSLLNNSVHSPSHAHLRAAYRAVVITLLAVIAIELFLSIRQESQVIDESAHLFAGEVTGRNRRCMLRRRNHAGYSSTTRRVIVSLGEPDSSFLEANMGNTTLIARLVDCWNTGKLEPIDEVLSLNFIRHEADIEGTTSGRDEYKRSVSRY